MPEPIVGAYAPTPAVVPEVTLVSMPAAALLPYPPSAAAAVTTWPLPEGHIPASLDLQISAPTSATLPLYHQAPPAPTFYIPTSNADLVAALAVTNNPPAPLPPTLPPAHGSYLLLLLEVAELEKSYEAARAEAERSEAEVSRLTALIEAAQAPPAVPAPIAVAVAVSAAAAASADGVPIDAPLPNKRERPIAGPPPPPAAPTHAYDAAAAPATPLNAFVSLAQEAAEEERRLVELRHQRQIEERRVAELRAQADQAVALAKLQQRLAAEGEAVPTEQKQQLPPLPQQPSAARKDRRTAVKRSAPPKPVEAADADASLETLVTMATDFVASLLATKK